MTTENPNVTIENSILIARPTEDIWYFLSDIVNDQQYIKIRNELAEILKRKMKEANEEEPMIKASRK